MRFVPLILFVGLVADGCLGDLGVDDARFACKNDRQCGGGARCIEGLCFVGDASPPADTNEATETGDTAAETSDTSLPEDTAPPGFTCSAPLSGAVTGGAASFRVEVREGRAVLVVDYDGLTTTVPLPPDAVVDVDSSGPLDACCENPCCPPYSQP